MVITDCNKCAKRSNCQIITSGDWNKCIMIQHFWDERAFDLFKRVLPTIIIRSPGITNTQAIEEAEGITNEAIDKLKNNPTW